MSDYWYVVRSKPRKEDFLWGQLRAREIECFYPRTRIRGRTSRVRKMRPYFPGYLFIHADVEQVGLSTLQWMPGAAGLVSFDGQPAWVPESLIQAIRKRVGQIEAAGEDLQLASLRHGDPVVIREGPFAGYEAVFDVCLSGEERVRVLLCLLSGQQLPLEISGSQIERQRRP